MIDRSTVSERVTTGTIHTSYDERARCSGSHREEIMIDVDVNRTSKRIEASFVTYMKHVRRERRTASSNCACSSVVHRQLRTTSRANREDVLRRSVRNHTTNSFVVRIVVFSITITRCIYSTLSDEGTRRTIEKYHHTHRKGFEI